ncbi:type II secretion system protein N [Enterobacter mori]|uniref:type II secretion system protein N n=1 Tax=Enterobacter mori TaxID=539813 RepID=UPI001B8B046D|nr:type II secretion system protein N [Enterobacter mori]MBS3050497.1 hypothetical protein [Enterobacter mori]
MTLTKIVSATWQSRILSHNTSRTLAIVLIVLVVWRIWNNIVPAWQYTAIHTDKADVSSEIPAIAIADLSTLPLFVPVPSAPESPFSVTLLSPDDPTIFNAPRTALPMRITGLVIGDDERLSTAIIEHNARQESYHLDSLLADGKARVVRLFADRVIIVHQGKYEALLFP